MTPGLPRGAVVKNPPVNAGDGRDASLISGSGISPEQEVATHSTPGFLPGKFHGQRSLAGYSPRGHKESDTTKQLHFFSSPKLFFCLLLLLAMFQVASVGADSPWGEWHGAWPSAGL